MRPQPVTWFISFHGTYQIPSIYVRRKNQGHCLCVHIFRPSFIRMKSTSLSWRFQVVIKINGWREPWRLLYYLTDRKFWRNFTTHKCKKLQFFVAFLVRDDLSIRCSPIIFHFHRLSISFPFLDFNFVSVFQTIGELFNSSITVESPSAAKSSTVSTDHCYYCYYACEAMCKRRSLHLH